MKRYSFPQIQDFIFRHSDPKYFEAEKVLYEKYLPNSPILPELRNPIKLRLKDLDGRMIMDLLSNTDVCIDMIWEARGFIMDGKKLVSIKDYLKDLMEKHHDEIVEWAKLSFDKTAESSQKIAVLKEQLPKMLLDHVYKMDIITALQVEMGDEMEKARQAEELEQAKNTEEEERARESEKGSDDAQNNTGQAAPANPAAPPAGKPDNTSAPDGDQLMEEAERKLMVSIIEELPYNEIRRLVFALNLDKGLQDQKSSTLSSTLSAHKAALEAKKKEGQE